MRKAVNWIGISMLGFSAGMMFRAVWIHDTRPLLLLLVLFFLGLLLYFTTD